LTKSLRIGFSGNHDGGAGAVELGQIAICGQADPQVGALPTNDGGYYLVGARTYHQGLFTSEGMGTTNALEALLTRARALGLSLRLTDPFYDINERQISVSSRMSCSAYQGKHQERRNGFPSGQVRDANKGLP
jgi:hypothetical protein